MARAKNEINASSMADIAFLLLIFYLVTTTMNVDAGISRILPPYVDQTDDNVPPVKERNVLKVRINQFDGISVGDQRVEVSMIKDLAKEFILNANNSENLPEFEEVDIPLLGGKTMVTKGIISLQNDKSTTYDTYIKVQNELTRAFNEMHNELSLRKFGKKYSELDDSQQGAIRKAIPNNRISEAEPRDLKR